MVAAAALTAESNAVLEMVVAGVLGRIVEKGRIWPSKVRLNIEVAAVVRTSPKTDQFVSATVAALAAD